MTWTEHEIKYGLSEELRKTINGPGVTMEGPKYHMDYPSLADIAVEAIKISISNGEKDIDTLIAVGQNSISHLNISDRRFSPFSFRSVANRLLGNN